MDIKLIVKETSGEYTPILIPDGINLNLMEIATMLTALITAI